MQNLHSPVRIRVAPPLFALLLAGCFAAQKERSGPTPPADTPAWSHARWVQWQPTTAVGERLIVIDLGGGEIDQLLDDPDVATVLNDRFAPIFLHPRARPGLTMRLGWPSVTAIDSDGCLRSISGAPTDSAALLAFLNRALLARGAGKRQPLPPPRNLELPRGGEGWTADDPGLAMGHLEHDRGAPAIVVQGTPYIWGNRSDVHRLAEVGYPTAVEFLERLPSERDWPAHEGPKIACPL